MELELKTIINEVLNDIRRREELETDVALAAHLQVDYTTIYRWRKGEIGEAARILIPHAYRCEPEVKAA